MLPLLLAASFAIQEPQLPPPPPQAPSGQQEVLRVYLDCPLCDLDFFRTEITFVNWVRDRHDADVHVVTSTEGTGSGGTDYTLVFKGQGRFEGEADTLHYVSPPDGTEDAIRRGLAHQISLGLMRFVAQTPMAAEIEIKRRPSAGGQGAAGREGRDPWNRWVFQVSGYGNISNERSTQYSYLRGGLSANRVTDAWKINLSVSGNTTRNAYQISDTSWFVSRLHGYNFSGLVVRSLGAHWSWGLKAEALSSTYSNQDLTLSGGPALEYDVFPYAEATHHQLRINYSVQAARFDYDQITLYGRTLETLYRHQLGVNLAAVQPWGSVSVGVDATQYLHDLRKYDAGLFGGLSLRIVKGLSIGAGGGYSAIHDQLYLPAAGATPEEIIARQRQLATSYSLWTYFNVTYTFGSIFNNVVNPRFGSSGGGGVIIMM